MAKHNTGKRVSKGQRISSRPLASKHPAQEPKATHAKTAMRSAFENVTVTKGVDLGGIAYKVMGALYTKAGTRPFGRGWTANLSVQTTKKLIAQGVFA